MEEYAVLRTPNGVVIEIVKPKQERANLFNHPIISYTVANLIEKAELMKSIGGELIGEIVDTHEGWGWFYARNSSGIIFQLQGPLPKLHT